MAAAGSAGAVMDRITGDIRDRTFAHLYILYGDEIYLRDQFRNNLRDALMPENPPMNYTRYSGRKTDAKEICQMADTMPFLSDHRLILIEDSGFFKSAPDSLVDLIGNIPESVYIIFCEESVDRRSRMYKAAVKTGYAGEFTTPDDGLLRRWLVQSARRGGHQISNAHAQFMINWCGTDMFRLHNEMEKLISYSPAGSAITDHHIREICSRQLKDTIFQLTSAIAAGSREDAFAAYRDLLGLETKPNQILYMLRREFRLLWMTKALSHQGEQDREIARKARIHPAFIGRYLRIQTDFNERDLRNITDELAGIQALIHTGRADARCALESFMTEHTKKESGVGINGSAAYS